MKQEVNESKRKIREQSETISTLQKQLDNNQFVAEFERSCSSHHEELCSPENLLNNSSDLILTNEKILTQTRQQHKEITRLENEIEHWKGKYEKTFSKLRTLETEKDETKSDLDAYINLQKQNLSSVQRENQALSQLQQKMTQIQALKAVTQKIRTEREEEVDEFSARIKKLEKDLHKSKTELQDNAIKISGLMTEKQHLEARNKSLQSRKVTYESTVIDKLQKEIEDCRKDNRSLDNRHKNEFHTKEVEFQLEMKNKSKELKDRMEDNKKLTNKISILEKQNENKTAAVEKGKIIGEHLSEKDALIKQIRKENAELKHK